MVGLEKIKNLSKVVLLTKVLKNRYDNNYYFWTEGQLLFMYDGIIFDTYSVFVAFI